MKKKSHTINSRNLPFIKLVGFGVAILAVIVGILLVTGVLSPTSASTPTSSSGTYSDISNFSYSSISASFSVSTKTSNTLQSVKYVAQTSDSCPVYTHSSYTNASSASPSAIANGSATHTATASSTATTLCIAVAVSIPVHDPEGFLPPSAQTKADIHQFRISQASVTTTDTSPPLIAINLVGDGKFSASANEAVKAGTWQYEVNNSSRCTPDTFEVNTALAAGNHNQFEIPDGEAATYSNRYICFRVQDLAGNTGYGHYHHLHTHQDTIEKYTHNAWSLVNDSRFEQEFKLQVADYQADNDHLRVRLAIPFPNNWELRGIDYLDVAVQSACQDALFREGSGQLISGYQLVDKGVTDFSHIDASLPVFTSNKDNYLCVRAEVWKEDPLGGFFGQENNGVKVFVTEQPISSLLASTQAQYSQLNVKHTDYDLPIFSKDVVRNHLDSLFMLYAAPAEPPNIEDLDDYAPDNPFAEINKNAKIRMSFNMPGKIRLGGARDIQGFVIEEVQYVYVESEGACHKDTFKNLRTTLANRFDEDRNRAHAYDNPDRALRFIIDKDRDGEYLCIKATIQGDRSSTSDRHFYKIFSYEIDLSGV